MPIGSINRQSIGTPCPSGEQAALDAMLARSVGFRPVFFPPSGAFVIAPSILIQFQSMPCRFVKLLDPGVPEFQEDASLDPLLKAVMSSGFGTQVWCA
jgi:hypothetical protein